MVATQGNDCFHSDRWFAATDVVSPNGSGNNEAPSHACAGGMVSSLLHVLIVTPVIFTWLREREMRRG